MSYQPCNQLIYYIYFTIKDVDKHSIIPNQYPKDDDIIRSRKDHCAEAVIHGATPAAVDAPSGSSGVGQGSLHGTQAYPSTIKCHTP